MSVTGSASRHWYQTSRGARQASGSLGRPIPQIHAPGTDFTASLGDDPAMDGFGSTRFKAEVPGITDPLSDHSYYYHRGSESLFSMSDIVSGHGDALRHDGMTAPHRGKILGVELDPELLREGTSGHTHQ
jgi:hypothetical protein